MAAPVNVEIPEPVVTATPGLDPTQWGNVGPRATGGPPATAMTSPATATPTPATDTPPPPAPAGAPPPNTPAPPEPPSGLAPVPKAASPDPKPVRPLPKPVGPVQKKARPLPKPVGPVPKAARPLPKPVGPVPKAGSTGDKPQTAATGSQAPGTTPKAAKPPGMGTTPATPQATKTGATMGKTPSTPRLLKADAANMGKAATPQAVKPPFANMGKAATPGANMGAPEPANTGGNMGKAAAPLPANTGGDMGKGSGKASGKAHHVPSGAGLILRGGHSVNVLKPGGKWHRSHGPSRERRILRHAIRGLQQFAADTVQWAGNQCNQSAEMAGFSAGTALAMGQMTGQMQTQANQIEFLAHSVGATRTEIEKEKAEMRKSMAKEKAEMQQAMEASIRQRVADEAGTNSTHIPDQKDIEQSAKSF